jgi:ATP-dependent exoDNAse (exonuclease V) alpha subunit
MIALEREVIEMMRRGHGRSQTLIQEATRQQLESDLARLNEPQQAAVQHLFSSRDQVTAFQGTAGVGKTTVLAVVRTAAEREAYLVEGFAPTSRAAHNLGESGIAASTLQHYLVRGPQPSDHSERPKRLLMVDEASLTSTVQAHALFRSLGPEDRVLLIGDVRQHQAVDAGRPFEQLQEAGIETVRLDAIVRQRDSALKSVVTELARGHVVAAVQQLRDQGRVHEFRDRRGRFTSIAQVYVEQPHGTLVVSPDNASRQELNDIIHRARQEARQVAREEQRMTVLVPRQDLAGADRQWAAQYAPADVVRYTKGSRAFGVKAGDYARVDQVDTRRNLVVVTRERGGQVAYDPRRLQGVTVYRDAQRAFSVGDRVQLTAPDKVRKLANRELGTIEAVDPHGTLTIRFDSGRTVNFKRDQDRHLDYGYAVTSHSSQGLTADRVLVHVDTAHRGAALLNRRFAYVALSRGRIDARIYTNDASKLDAALGRETSHRSALEVTPDTDRTGMQIRPSSASVPVARKHARRQQELAR